MRQILRIIAPPPRMGHRPGSVPCGCSSVVERNLAKVDVVGSNPIIRSLLYHHSSCDHSSPGVVVLFPHPRLSFFLRTHFLPDQHYYRVYLRESTRFHTMSALHCFLAFTFLASTTAAASDITLTTTFTNTNHSRLSRWQNGLHNIARPVLIPEQWYLCRAQQHHLYPHPGALDRPTPPPR